MRHQNKGFKLGRSHSHREATLAALSTALIRHKHITTTLTRAKALRMYVEPILNRGKEDTTHNRRMVFRELQDKHAVTELFTTIGPKISDRPGGYTRVVKLGQRAGDSAEMAVIELVDYGDPGQDGTTSGRRRRTRRSAGRKTGAAAAVAAVKETASAVADKVEEIAEVVEDKVEDAVEAVAEVAADVVDKIEDVAEAVEEKVESVVESAKEAVAEVVSDEPTVEAPAEPVAEAHAEPVAEAPAEPVAEAHAEAPAEPATDTDAADDGAAPEGDDEPAKS